MVQKDFINITTYRTPLACANILHPYIIGKEKITPEFCREMLSSTNHHRIISDLANLIFEEIKQMPETYNNYETILSSMLGGREQPEELSARIKKTIRQHNPKFSFDSSKNKIRHLIKSSGLHEHLLDLSNLNPNFFGNHYFDFSGVNKIIFPKTLDYLIWDRFKNLSGKIDLSENHSIKRLEIGGDLSAVEEIIFPPFIENIDINYAREGDNGENKISNPLYDFSQCDRLKTIYARTTRKTSLLINSPNLETLFFIRRNS